MIVVRKKKILYILKGKTENRLFAENFQAHALPTTFNVHFAWVNEKTEMPNVNAYGEMECCKRMPQTMANAISISKQALSTFFVPHLGNKSVLAWKQHVSIFWSKRMRTRHITAFARRGCASGAVVMQRNCQRSLLSCLYICIKSSFIMQQCQFALQSHRWHFVLGVYVSISFSVSFFTFL